MAIKINTRLSRITEVILRHTPQLRINSNLHTNNKVLHTLSRVRHHTNLHPLNLRTEPHKLIPTNLRTTTTVLVTALMAHQALTERRALEQR